VWSRERARAPPPRWGRPGSRHRRRNPRRKEGLAPTVTCVPRNPYPPGRALVIEPTPSGEAHAHVAVLGAWNRPRRHRAKASRPARAVRSTATLLLDQSANTPEPPPGPHWRRNSDFGSIDRPEARRRWAQVD